MKRGISCLLAIAVLFSLLPFGRPAAAVTLEDNTQEETQPAFTTASKTLVAATGFAVGTGTQEDPYLITSPEEYAYFAASMDATKDRSESYSGKYISLAADIDLSVYTNAYSIVRMCALQIFYGTFDGNGFTITLHADTYTQHASCFSSTHYCTERGLFGWNYGTIRNLNIVVPSMEFAGQYNGVVAGRNAGLIENVHVDVDGTITVKTPDQNVASHYYGGIVGNNDGGTITYSSFTGFIETHSSCVFKASNTQLIGGIAGYGGTVRNCQSKQNKNNYTYSIVTVSSANEVPFYIGGIVGMANIVENCCVVGGVLVAHDRNQRGGGIAGGHISSSSYIKNCYVLAENISGGEYIGGIVGFASGYVYNCYSDTYNLTAQTGAKCEGFAGVIAGACVNNNKGFIVGSYARTPDSIYRTVWVDGSGCDEGYWDDSKGRSQHENSQTGTTGIDFTYNLAVNTLGWGIYSSYSDTLNNPQHVWSCSNIVGVLPSIYVPQYLTVRYTDETNQIFRVNIYYYDDGTYYSIPSPERYGASADKPVVTGTFSGSQLIDVKYGHVHIPGDAATCTSPQRCTLCGVVLAEMLPHPYAVTEVVAPTCTENGYTVHTCSACSASYRDTFTAPHGHQLNSAHQCTVCGAQFEAPLRDYVIYIYDIETGDPIEGANVTLGDTATTTDGSGAAKFQLKSSADTTLKITAASYPEHPKSAYAPNDRNVDHIYLTSNESDIYGAWCNGDNVLNGDSQINAKAHALKAKIVVNGRAKANIIRYELVQDSSVIAESTDGQFTVMNAYFKIGKDVYVRMYTDGTEGHNVFERKLNIKVVGYVFNFETDLKHILPFSTGLKLTFPDGTPGFAGFELKAPNPFLKTTDITYRHENDRAIILFGFDHDFAEDPELEDMETGDLFEKMLDDWASEKKVDKTREVHGSLALAVEFSESGITKVYGQINVGFHLEFAAGQTFMVGIIPIYGEAVFSAEGEMEVSEIGYDAENAKLLIPTYQVPLEGSITLYAGLGCHVVSAGVYGQTTVQLVLSSDQAEAFEKFSISGELGLYAKVKLLFFKELCYKYPLLHGERTWPDHAREAQTMLYSLDQYTTDQREYLHSRSEWMNISLLAEDAASHVFLQDSTYTAIEPKVVTCGDTVMMVFLDDDGSDGLNYQHLYYSLYNGAAGTWSEPVRVDTNDCPDVEFDVCADEDTIYIAYSEIEKITEENKEDPLILGSAEIVAAQYSIEEGRFTGHTALSSNGSFDTLPKISDTPDGVTVAWVNNFTNDLFSQNANNVILVSALRGGQWTAAVPVKDRGATVVSMDVGALEGKPYVAAVCDIDCDLSTTDDRVVHLIGMDGSSKQIAMEDNGNDGVQFVEMSGAERLLWYNHANLYQIAAAGDIPTPVFEEEVSSLSGNYSFLQMDGEQYAILFTQNDQTDDGSGKLLNGSNIYGMFYSDGCWGRPVPVTQNEAGRYADAYGVCMYAQKLVIPYISAQTDITENDIVKNTAFMSMTFELTNDLSVGAAEYRPSELFEGTAINIQIPVTNHSWQKLSDLTVDVMDPHGSSVFSGIPVYESADGIGSGETEYVSFSLPKNLLSAGETYSVTIRTEDWTDRDESNNITPLNLWYTDFAIDASQVVLQDTARIQYAITNSGNIGGSAALRVYRLAEDGTETEICTQDISTLQAGQSVSGSLEVTPSYYPDNAQEGTVILAVVSDREELYHFNDSVSISVGGIESGTTTETDSSDTVIASPAIDTPHIAYDKASSGNISVTVQENGWAFTGITEIPSEHYTYKNGILVISSDYLHTRSEGYCYYTLSYSNAGKTTNILLIVEISDSTYENAVITAEDQSVKYDGNAPVLGEDILYTTESAGAVSAAYSADNGTSWELGLPVDIGSYLVRLTVAQDDENRYLPATHTFTLTVEKGTRAISVPGIQSTAELQVHFGGALPTAGVSDGTVLYGYSLTNDVASVSEWSAAGVLPKADSSTLYYVFAKIINGENYEDAYSLGYPMDAHVHDYSGDTWHADGESHWKVCGSADCGEAAAESRASHSSEKAENMATCQKQAVCDVCGTSYGSHADHSFTEYSSNGDGTKTSYCDYGCGTAKTVSDGTAGLPRPTASISARDTLDMNFYLKKSDFPQQPNFIVKLDGEVLDAGTYSLGFNEEKNSWSVTVSLYANHMCKEVTVQAVDEAGNALSRVRTLSIRDIAGLLMGMENTTAEERRVMLAMLDYGTAAQLAMNADETDFANSYITAEMRNAIMEGFTWPETNAPVDAAEGTFADSRFTANVSALQTVTLNYYIKVADLGEDTIKVTLDGEVLEEGVHYTLSPDVASDGAERVKVSIGVNANKMCDVYTVQVVDQDGKAVYAARSMSVRHCIGLSLATMDEANKACAIAMLDYGAMAQIAFDATATDLANRYLER